MRPEALRQLSPLKESLHSWLYTDCIAALIVELAKRVRCDSTTCTYCEHLQQFLRTACKDRLSWDIILLINELHQDRNYWEFYDLGRYWIGTHGKYFAEMPDLPYEAAFNKVNKTVVAVLLYNTPTRSLEELFYSAVQEAQQMVLKHFDRLSRLQAPTFWLISYAKERVEKHPFAAKQALGKLALEMRLLAVH